jgi:citrate synthase
LLGRLSRRVGRTEKESRVSSAGLRGVVAGNSAISTVDGLEGRLIYRGYEIRDLAEHAAFEEVVYLLWHGDLPTRSQLRALNDELAAAAELPAGVMRVLEQCPAGARPMDVLRTGVSALGMWDEDAGDNSLEANRRKSVRLTARIPALIAAFHALRSGRRPEPPRPELGLAGSFLAMLAGRAPDEADRRIFDVSLTLHADHEFNASTFSARVTIATLADMYSAITSAVGTLSGPLHGGANEGVLRMLRAIGSVDRAEAWVHERLAAGEKIMGIGHAVYKTTDPRAAILKEMAGQLTRDTGRGQLFEMSTRIEALMLAEKGLHANVDFYSASVYDVLGIPVDLFTPVFAISRISGWTAHVMEQLADNRLIRPRAEYVGPLDRVYVPIDRRG